MKEERVWREYTALPPELKQQVADFIIFLRARYTPSSANQTAKRTKLASEPFIGMWRNREDLQDSSAWVRNTRQREWVNRHA
jgi:hypothetical protein